MKKIISIALTICLSIFILIGCAPKDDPSIVLNNYYDNIKSGSPELAYNDLADVSKKNFDKDDFIKWQRNEAEVMAFKSTDIKESNKYKNKILDGNSYKNAVEFDITENEHDNYNNKDTSIKYKRYVVNDNGKWKVYREKEDGKDLLADSMNKLAWMYIDGKGKDKDMNKAAIILNEAIKAVPEYTGTYYTLAYTYCKLERFDESILSANKYIEKTTDDEAKSDAYNILGLSYEGKKDYTNASKYYNQSIKLDSNNQYAKSNLVRVNKLVELKTALSN